MHRRSPTVNKERCGTGPTVSSEHQNGRNSAQLIRPEGDRRPTAFFFVELTLRDIPAAEPCPNCGGLQQKESLF
jgi:hypothetical protein